MEQLFDDLDDFGSFDDAISGDVRDPYTELARLRREEPVQRLETSGALPHEESLPMFIVYRHEDVQQMLRDNETFSSSAVIAAFGPVLGEGVMLGMDEPIHGRLRSLVSKAFSQKSLARWQDELVGRVANSLIDNFAPNGKADLVKEFTFDYPSQIIAGLLGLPEKDYPQFQRWSISLLSWLMNPERGLAASAALCDYFAPILEARRAEPKDDLISALGAAEIDGEKLADEEIFSFLRLLLPAGVETTYRSLGSLLLGLLSDPQQLDAIRADRSLLPQAIEEGVRWEPPLLTITRVATRDTELGGVSIPAGATVMPMLGSANRQEDRYPDPDTFNIHREARANLGWGHGVHVCLGMHLARLEMRTAINLLLDRLPNLRLDPDADDPHVRGQVFRSPTSVPVLFDPLFDDLDDFGSFDDAISGDVRDPYTELARLRREEPVQRLETSGALPHEESLPMFIVYRHEDVQQMLRDNETFSSAAVIAAFGPVLGEGVMLGMDEPIHGRLRSLVSKAFSQKSLARWQDELVGRVANSLIDNFAPNGKADLVKEFTFDYPSQIIAGLLGLPEKDYPQFQRWSISLLSWLMNPERGLAASAALCDYFAPILEARRAEPKDDLISALGAAEIDGEELADEEIFSFLRLLLPAGVETTYRSLGSLLLGLLSDPQQLDAIRADRSLLPQAIEEGVRWEPPLLTITRVATRDTELGGVYDPGRGDRDADARFGEPARRSLPPIPTRSTSTARLGQIWAGATAYTSASACTWRGWKCAPPSPFYWTGCPT